MRMFVMKAVNTDKPSILIADDHPIFRQGVRDIIETDGRWHVIAEAINGQEALAKYQQCHPDIVILDMSMGEISGLDVAAEICAENSPTRCIILTMYHDEIFRQQAEKTGVAGYLLKEHTSEALLDCLTEVAHHAGFRLKECHPSEDTMVVLQQLSAKEQQILRAVATLKTNTQIAQEFAISVRTVENHRSNIAKKLSLRGRNAVLHFALKHFQN